MMILDSVEALLQNGLNKIALKLIMLFKSRAFSHGSFFYIIRAVWLSVCISSLLNIALMKKEPFGLFPDYKALIEKIAETKKIMHYCPTSLFMKGILSIACICYW